ncbi:unnamed protein product [Protopolystoma xenopodis]|uniref:Uncharacterized protein n=1 Tax=Protopolystoma xenopodis TaxID=117903 RepID=A0A3S5BP32_9PLAT|nr:unnamed protein product [Protopolystoma xenopodis]
MARRWITKLFSFSPFINRSHLTSTVQHFDKSCHGKQKPSSQLSVDSSLQLWPLMHQIPGIGSPNRDPGAQWEYLQSKNRLRHNVTAEGTGCPACRHGTSVDRAFRTSPSSGGESEGG